MSAEKDCNMLRRINPFTALFTPRQFNAASEAIPFFGAKWHEF